MIRTTLFVWATLYFILPSAGLAQEPVPVIQLSAEETTQAQQGMQNFDKARDRYTKAELTWRTFRQIYQAAHPELPSLRFTSDFRLAFVLPDLNSHTISAVALTADEQRQGQTLYREMLESGQALQQAQKNWLDYQHQLVLNHHILNNTGSSMPAMLDGKPVSIPCPWCSGVAFTPDFRFAVPLQPWLRDVVSREFIVAAKRKQAGTALRLHASEFT